MESQEVPCGTISIQLIVFYMHKPIFWNCMEPHDNGGWIPPSPPPAIAPQGLSGNQGFLSITRSIVRTDQLSDNNFHRPCLSLRQVHKRLAAD